MPDKPLHLSDPEKVEAFVREVLLSPERKIPVVAISTVPKTGHVWIQPQPLHDELGENALVAVVETGDATWRLSGLLPDRLDVFGGAVRVWWPQLHADSNPYDHPLNLIFDERKADTTRRQIVRSILAGDSRARPAADSGTPSNPAADPWARLRDEYRPDYVVRGRVAHITDRYVLVELLPGATAIVHISELDYGWLDNPADSVAIDQVVAVQLLSLDTDAQRCEASIKRAYGQEVRPGIALRPDDPPFLGDAAIERTANTASGETQRFDELEEERLQLLDERKRLVARNRELGELLATQRKEIKSLEDRLAYRERLPGHADPLSSETAFISAVRVEYALRFGEDDRKRYPLQRMKVGREFLNRVRDLDGIDVDKILEVAAQVASARCHEIPGRAVHELHAGEGGTPTRARTSDGARAWRCALQIGTPSARRLHWWSIPGADGATIEFASVAVHDDFGIPE
ncbi:MAG: S1 RNA-binding domain-containing protein [Deltaproteobacteria bacterium]|nr:S1 RNA-binding domain-containing protein [Deltaproteobacteria bacterium]